MSEHTHGIPSSPNPHPIDSDVRHVEAHTGDTAHIVPPKFYLLNFVFLIVMMALTVWVSDFHLGTFNNVLALAIAISKALAVILVFMGVRWGTKLTWLWAGLGFFWFLLMFGILSDYITREWIHVQGWQNPYWYK